MTEATQDIDTLAKGGRTNIAGFVLRLAARIPFLFIAGRIYGPDLVGRFAIAVVVVELAALLATLGLKRGLAQALSSADRPHANVVWDAMAVALSPRSLPAPCSAPSRRSCIRTARSRGSTGSCR